MSRSDLVVEHCLLSPRQSLHRFVHQVVVGRLGCFQRAESGFYCAGMKTIVERAAEVVMVDHCGAWSCENLLTAMNN